MIYEINGQHYLDDKEWKLSRDGDRDVILTGRVIGHGEYGTGDNSGFAKDWNRGVNVTIWRTSKGRYVVAIEHWSRWQGENGSEEIEIYDTPEELLAGLRRNDGRIPQASKEAWEDACEHDSALEALRYEEV